MLVAKVSPDITPLLSGSDLFLDSLEKAFLEFIRNGAMNHVLGVAPFAFNHFSRAMTLIESLLCKFHLSDFIYYDLFSPISIWTLPLCLIQCSSCARATF